MAGFLCYPLSVSPQKPSKDIRDDADRWNVLQCRVQQTRTVQAVEVFRSQGIEPIVIKGVAAARYYPSEKGRSSVDVDLAVARHQFARAKAIAESATGLAIDVHRELRHLDTVPWNDLVANSVELSFHEGTVRVLRPEDDLRVLCVHWLTDGGVHRDRLWDMYYAISRRGDPFNWERFLSVVSPTRQRWIECVLGLAAKYLELDLTSSPLAGAENRIPDWVIRTVEREWEAEIKPLPLEASLFDRKMLLTQVKRRLRPNPLYATVDCEGSFDARTRLFYQVRNGLHRVRPSIKRMTKTLRVRYR
jgi:hypothetical protein